MSDDDVIVTIPNGNESVKVKLDTLVGAYHAFGVLTNLHHLMIGHHDSLTVIEVADDAYPVPTFVWDCPASCDADKEGTTVTWIPSEDRDATRLVKCVKNIPGFVLPDVIFEMTQPGNEMIHTHSTFRMQGRNFGFMEIR